MRKREDRTVIAEYYLKDKLDVLPDEVLLNEWDLRSREVDVLTREMGICEMELNRRMHKNHAQKLLHPTLDVQLGSPSYDIPKLRGLGEHMPPDEFNKGFIPAHDETVTRYVPDKFDMRTVNSWRKFGQHISAVIDGAEIALSRRISIKHKKESTSGAVIPRQNTTKTRQKQEELDVSESS